MVRHPFCIPYIFAVASELMTVSSSRETICMSTPLVVNTAKQVEQELAFSFRFLFIFKRIF